MKNKKVGVIIGLSITLIVTVLYLSEYFVGIENKTIDWRFNFHQQKYKASEIVIITVDEDSIKVLGRWPWPRKQHAELINLLSKYKAKTILFDMFFVEPDKVNPLSDKALAIATKNAGNVIHEYFFTSVIQITPTPKGDIRNENTVSMYPLDEIAESARMLGSPNVISDSDGVTRRITSYYVGPQKWYTEAPFIGLVVASHFSGKKPEQLLSDLKIDKNEKLLINYLGHTPTLKNTGIFRYFSYRWALDSENQEVLRKSVENKIVIVGGSALSLFDVKVSPLDDHVPGVEVVATTTYNFLHNNFIKEVPVVFSIVICLVFGIASAFIFSRSSPFTSGVVFIISVAAYFLACWYLMIYRFSYVEFTAPTFIITMNYTFIIFYRFISEEKEKRWLKKTFGQYLSPAVINEIMKDPAALALGGKRQEMTVLFSDIRGFTTISEASTPEEIVALLNEYLTKMTEIVFKYEGTLDKFIGDAVMAFWNAPLPQKDHAKLGVMCAIEMIEELKILQDKWRAEKRPVIEIGIGVNTGDMVVGNMGSIERMDYTVIGDNVNLGARLESLNKEFKTRIIISESTYNYVKDAVTAKSLGTTKVKGKEKSVQIYSVEGRL